MIAPLSRLLRPETIAVIGGGAWTSAVIAQCRRMGFEGAIWPVHPTKPEVESLPAFPSIKDLPGAPDASFVGINRLATIETIGALAKMGAGGAVCFASGFSESLAEDAGAGLLQEALVEAAGTMPILGPNCYGLINALDGALLWPDQHGCQRVDRGVAILTQSSNIAINLTMQRRGLPIAYVVTCGNGAQTGQAQIAADILDDPRVTAIGLHIEGISDLRAWESLAQKAAARGVPIVALKVGRSTEAQRATISHTASLAGSDQGAGALLARLGIGRVDDLPSFLETLKLMHFAGRLPNQGIASISCSGGEASLIADMAHEMPLHFPALNQIQTSRLAATLGPMVALANPLDYHTYIWRDVEAMTNTFAAMTGPDIALSMIIADYPHTDHSDWECVTKAAIEARARTDAPIAVVASLPELMPTDISKTLSDGGVIPFNGLREALIAASVAATMHAPDSTPLLLPGAPRESVTLSEHQAKQALAAHGLAIPHGHLSARADIAQTAAGLSAPLVLKGMGHAHKSEAGLVALNLSAQTIAEAAQNMQADTFLIEEMVTQGIAELLVGVTRDPAHGFCLTVAAGGVMTELMQDAQTLLIPASPKDIRDALLRLRMSPLLTGFRGKPGADLDAVIAAVSAIQSYVIENAGRVEEVEVNPLICTAHSAVAADALIKESPK